MDLLKKYKSLSISPWAFFFLFLVTNSCLSYGSFSIAEKSWIFIFGLIVPFGVGFLATAKAEFKIDFQEEISFFEPDRLFWFGVIFLALFLRFFHLTSFHLWPTGDEGLHGFLAIPLVEKWDWQFFDTVGEQPPLLIDSLVRFYQWSDSPFCNI